MDVEPDMVAGGQRAGRIVEPLRPRRCGAGVQLSAERLDLHPQPIGLAGVVAEHVQHHAASPELFAMLEFVDHGGAIVGVVPSDHDEHAHAQAHEAARHPIENKNGNREQAPEAFQCDFHERNPKQFACR